MAAKNSPPDKPVLVAALKKRGDFLRARKGARSHERAFVLQLVEPVIESKGSCPCPLRVGLTVTKKIGNAVERNRIKRRLRNAVRQADIPANCAGKDCVLIARREAIELPFDDLIAQIGKGLARASRTKRKDNVAKQT